MLTNESLSRIAEMAVGQTAEIQYKTSDGTWHNAGTATAAAVTAGVAITATIAGLAPGTVVTGIRYKTKDGDGAIIDGEKDIIFTVQNGEDAILYRFLVGFANA